MHPGIEWLVEAEGCCPDRLRNLEQLQQLCARIISDLDLHVVGAGHWHQFPDPGGITGMFLLSESHLTCHTYPEIGLATFNLYCCRSRPAWPWSEHLREALGAVGVIIQTAQRGVGAASFIAHGEGGS